MIRGYYNPNCLRVRIPVDEGAVVPNDEKQKHTAILVESDGKTVLRCHQSGGSDLMKRHLFSLPAKRLTGRVVDHPVPREVRQKTHLLEG